MNGDGVVGGTAASGRLVRDFFLAAGVALLVGATAGAIGSVYSGWTASPLAIAPFEILRPIHTTFVLAWIFLAYTGCLYAFLPEVCGAGLFSARLSRAHWALLLAAGTAALATYALRVFSGREYLDFVPPVSAVILVAWAFFLANFFGTVRRRRGPWPVYLWMWATGLVAFAATFVEGHLWFLSSHFRDNLGRDLTVQWKSYGSLIGSWNMVVYGLSLYVLERVAGEGGKAFRLGSFAFYWLSLLNLMFNFGHHNYQSPQAGSVKTLGFVISMTELAILAQILLERLRPWTPAGALDPRYRIPRAFLGAASVWVLVNLVLSIAISIPAINGVTHGTHVTVAHAMGCTIGINSMILWAAGWTVLLDRCALAPREERQVRIGFWILNVGLAGLFAHLLLAGGVRGVAVVRDGMNFHQSAALVRPILRGFVIAGAAAFAGIVWLTACWFRGVVRAFRGPGSGVAGRP